MDKCTCDALVEGIEGLNITCPEHGIMTEHALKMQAAALRAAVIESCVRDGHITRGQADELYELPLSGEAK